MAGKGNGRRNRSAGKGWELCIIKMLKKENLYQHAVSTRSESRSLDGCGIDVMNRNEAINGQMLDSIQAKSEVKTVPYPKLLARIREAKRSNPVVFHRQTAKAGSRFMIRDEFAITYLSTYIQLLKNRKAVEEIKEIVKKDPAILSILSKYGL